MTLDLSIGAIVAFVVGCIILQVTGSILGIWAYKKMTAGLWENLSFGNDDEN
jgi:uncharacterized membrane protein YjgN (DUF898 family)